MGIPAAPEPEIAFAQAANGTASNSSVRSLLEQSACLLQPAASTSLSTVPQTVSASRDGLAFHPLLLTPICAVCRVQLLSHLRPPPPPPPPSLLPSLALWQALLPALSVSSRHPQGSTRLACVLTSWCLSRGRWSGGGSGWRCGRRSGWRGRCVTHLLFSAAPYLSLDSMCPCCPRSCRPLCCTA